MAQRATWLLLLPVTAAPAAGAAKKLTVICPDRGGLCCSQLVRVFVVPVVEGETVTFDFVHKAVDTCSRKGAKHVAHPDATERGEFKVNGPACKGSYDLDVRSQTGGEGGLPGLLFTDAAKPDPTNPFTWTKVPVEPHEKPGYGGTKLAGGPASRAGQSEGPSSVRFPQELATPEQLAQAVEDKSWRQRLPEICAYCGVPLERVPWLTRALASESETTRTQAARYLCNFAKKAASRSHHVAPKAILAIRTEGTKAAAERPDA